MIDKPNENANGLAGAGEHIPPGHSSVCGNGIPLRQLEDGGILRDYADAVFGYSLGKYPGKLRASADSLGLRLSTYKAMAYGNAVSRISLPLALRAAKILRSKIVELTRLADRFEAIARERQARPKSRGFLDVRVRDDTGIPRNARWRGGPKPPAF